MPFLKISQLMRKIYFELANFFSRSTRTTEAIKQIFYSFILQGLSIVIGILYVPLLLNYLTQEKYGIWLTLTSILGWFSFFDIGLGNGLRNKLTEAFAVKNYVLGQKYVSTTYVILIGIFSSILFIFHFSNFFLNWNLILNTDSIGGDELYILTSIVFSFFLIRFVVQLISNVYFADQKPSFSKVITTSANLLSFILVLILTNSAIKGNLVLLGSIISAIPVLLFIVVTIIAFNGRYKLVKPSFKAIDFKISKGLISLGAKFFFLQITAIIVFSTSSFFIAQFYGPSEVVVYNIAFKYFQLPIMVFSIIMAPIWSAVTDAYAKSDFVWLSKTLKRLNFISILFSIGIIFMVFLSNWIFKIWIGDKVKIPLNLSIALAFYTIMQIYLTPYSYFINGFGKIKLTMNLTIIGVSSYLILIYAFGKIFTNSTGVVLAIILSSFLGGIMQPIQTYKILRKTAKGIWNE
jgi:O-antigen/teichoic acid export membrane protein